MLSLNLLHLFPWYHSYDYVSCCSREAVFVCCIFLFFQKLQMFIISFKYCLNGSWKITAFSRRGLSLYLGRRITTDLEERAYHRQSDHQSSAEHSSWLHLKFWVSGQELGDKGLLGFTLHFITLPLQKLTSEWDERTKESQICYPGKFELLVSQIKQILWERRLPIQLGYSLFPHLSVFLESFWVHHFQRSIFSNI